MSGESLQQAELCCPDVPSNHEGTVTVPDAMPSQSVEQLLHRPPRPARRARGTRGLVLWSLLWGQPLPGAAVGCPACPRSAPSRPLLPAPRPARWHAGPAAVWRLLACAHTCSCHRCPQEPLDLVSCLGVCFPEDPVDIGQHLLWTQGGSEREAKTCRRGRQVEGAAPRPRGRGWGGRSVCTCGWGGAG